MKWSMLKDLSVHNMSLPFDTPAVSANQNWKCVCGFLSENRTIGVVLSLSSSSNSSIRCCPPTPRPSTEATHQLLQTACAESSCSCFSLLIGFCGFIPTLGISASKGSSTSSFPISTSARDFPTGSMSSPSGATSRFRVFVGLTSAQLCHLRFPTPDSSSQDQHWSPLISLLDSGRN